MRRVKPITSAALALAAASASAHHSIAGVYDGSRQVTVEGEVTEFRFVNPHPIVVIDVAAAGGPQSWQLEMDNRFELAGIGITADTFEPGDRVIATGSASRTCAGSTGRPTASATSRSAAGRESPGLESR